MNNKIYSFIGLAKKAGRLVSGDETCERAARADKLRLLIVAQDASDNTKQKYLNMTGSKNIKMIFFGEKYDLGRILGRDQRAVLGITDVNFSERLIQMLQDSNISTGGATQWKNTESMSLQKN